MKNKAAIKNRAANVVIAVLILIIGLCCAALKAEGCGAQRDMRCDERKYGAMEREYCEQVTDILARYRLADSGINLTRIIGEDGMRQYQLEIHHARIGKLSGSERRTLEQEIGMLEFPDEACSVSVKISYLNEIRE